MASGPALYVVRVEHRVSSLQLLCQQAVASALREDKDVSKLTLPPRLCSYLSTAFIPTIKVKPSPSSFLTLLAACLPRKDRREEGRVRETGQRPRAGPQKPCGAPEFCRGPPRVLSVPSVSVPGGLALCEGCELSCGKGSIPSLTAMASRRSVRPFRPDLRAEVAIIPT